MKKLNITTSKGCFMIVDQNGLDKVAGQAFVDMYGDYTPLSELTEEQASEIVDSTQKGGFLKCYFDYTKGYYSNIMFTALGSLHSLIKSKGWFTSNPYKKPEHYDLWAKYGDFTQYGKSLTESVERWQQAESRTLHNPVIFKIN